MVFAFILYGYSWSPEVESDDFRGVRKFKISPLVSAHPMALSGVIAYLRGRRALKPIRAECSSLAPAGVIPHTSPLFHPSDIGASPIFPPSSRHSCPKAWELSLARGNVRRLMYRRIGIPGIAVMRRTSLRVPVFIEFVYWLNLVFGSAPDPFGGRGGMAMSHPRCARLSFLHSEIGQDAPASVCLTGACSSLLYSAKCLFLSGIVTGAAGRNRGGVVETPLFARTQGGNFYGARHRCFWS